MKTRALAAALVATAAVMSTGCTQPRPPAEFTLVGSFQPAVGCATEWDVSCGETGMTPTDGRHSVELDLPAGGHEFKVTRTGGFFELVDQRSLNGTYVNGERVDRAVLDDGAELRIGKFRLNFFVSPADRAAVAGG